MPGVRSHELRALLRSRELLVKSRVMLENHLRGILKAFGRKVGKVDQARFERRVRELVDGDNILEQVVGSMLRVRREVLDRLDELHRLVLAAVKADPVCRLLMTVPGVGPVTALAYRTAIEEPGRFVKSQLGWRSLRSDAEEVRLRRDGSEWRHNQVRRSDGSHASVGGAASKARSARTRPMPAPPTRTRGSIARVTASRRSSATSGTR